MSDPLSPLPDPVEEIDPAFNVNWMYDMKPVDPTEINIDDFYHIIICDSFNKLAIVKYKQPNVLVYSQEEFIAIVEKIQFKAISVAFMISTKNLEFITNFTMQYFYPLAIMIRKFNNGGLYIYNCDLGAYKSMRDVCVLMDSQLRFVDGIMLSNDITGDTNNPTKEKWMLDWRIQNDKETLINKGDIKEINRIDDYIKDVTNMKFHLGFWDDIWDFMNGGTEAGVSALAPVVATLEKAFGAFPVENLTCSIMEGTTQNMFARVLNFLRLYDANFLIDDVLFQIAMYKYYYINLSGNGTSWNVSDIGTSTNMNTIVKDGWQQIVKMWKDKTEIKDQISNVTPHWDNSYKYNPPELTIYSRDVFRGKVDEIYVLLCDVFGNSLTNKGVYAAQLTNTQEQMQRIKTYIKAVIDIKYKYTTNVISLNFLEYLNSLIPPAFITSWLIYNNLIVSSVISIVDINDENTMNSFIDANTNSTPVLSYVKMTGSVASLIAANEEIVSFYKTMRRIATMTKSMSVQGGGVAYRIVGDKLKPFKAKVQAKINSFKLEPDTPIRRKSVRTMENFSIKLEHKIVDYNRQTNAQKKIYHIDKPNNTKIAKIKSSTSFKQKSVKFTSSVKSSVKTYGSASVSEISPYTKGFRVAGAVLAVVDLVLTAYVWAKDNEKIDKYKKFSTDINKNLWDGMISLLNNKDFVKINETGNECPCNVSDVAKFPNLNDKYEAAEYDNNGVETRKGVPHTWHTNIKGCFDQLVAELQKNNDTILANMIIACVGAAVAIVIAVGTAGLAIAPAVLGVFAMLGVASLTASIVMIGVGADIHASAYDQILKFTGIAENLFEVDEDATNVILKPKTCVPNNDPTTILLDNKRRQVLLQPSLGECVASLVSKIKIHSLNVSTRKRVIDCNTLKGMLPLMYLENNDLPDIISNYKAITVCIKDLYDASNNTGFTSARNDLLGAIEIMELESILVTDTNKYLYDMVSDASFNTSNTFTTSVNNLASNYTDFITKKLKAKTHKLFAKKVLFKVNDSGAVYSCQRKVNTPSTSWMSGWVRNSSYFFSSDENVLNSIINEECSETQSFNSGGDIIIPDICEFNLFKLETPLSPNSIDFTEKNIVSDNELKNTSVHYWIWHTNGKRWTNENVYYDVQSFSMTDVSQSSNSGGGQVGFTSMGSFGGGGFSLC